LTLSNFIDGEFVPILSPLGGSVGD